mmetsp:Transcript_2778/g.7294  ORF Transcript_2778/g.7294 Transcript_2778/m.7294 type:complete len:324 (+) Transcript_2778:1172-2143(+)
MQRERRIETIICLPLSLHCCVSSLSRGPKARRRCFRLRFQGSNPPSQCRLFVFEQHNLSRQLPLALHGVFQLLVPITTLPLPSLVRLSDTFLHLLHPPLMLLSILLHRVFVFSFHPLHLLPTLLLHPLLLLLRPHPVLFHPCRRPLQLRPLRAHLAFRRLQLGVQLHDMTTELPHFLGIFLGLPHFLLCEASLLEEGSLGRLGLGPRLGGHDGLVDGSGSQVDLGRCRGGPMLGRRGRGRGSRRSCRVGSGGDVHLPARGGRADLCQHVLGVGGRWNDDCVAADRIGRTPGGRWSLEATTYLHIDRGRLGRRSFGVFNGSGNG